MSENYVLRKWSSMDRIFRGEPPIRGDYLYESPGNSNTFLRPASGQGSPRSPQKKSPPRKLSPQKYTPRPGVYRLRDDPLDLISLLPPRAKSPSPRKVSPKIPAGYSVRNVTRVPSKSIERDLREHFMTPRRKSPSPPRVSPKISARYSARNVTRVSSKSIERDLREHFMTPKRKSPPRKSPSPVRRTSPRQIGVRVMSRNPSMDFMSPPRSFLSPSPQRKSPKKIGIRIASRNPSMDFLNSRGSASTSSGHRVLSPHYPRRKAKYIAPVTDKAICDWVPNRKKFSKGANGSLYRTTECKECEFMPKGGQEIVFKIEKKPDCKYFLAEAVRMNNMAAAHGLAPMIYEYSVCQKSGQCRMYMDYIPGDTLGDVLRSGHTSLMLPGIQSMFDRLQGLHRVLPHGHGDLHYDNIMYTPDSPVMFIDISTGYAKYKKRHFVSDYAQLLYYTWFKYLDIPMAPKLAVTFKIFTIFQQGVASGIFPAAILQFIPDDFDSDKAHPDPHVLSVKWDAFLHRPDVSKNLHRLAFEGGAL